MMKIAAITFLFLLFIQKTEVIFGKKYETFSAIDYGDYEIYYHKIGYKLNGKVVFGIKTKGVRNDTVVMRAKKRILDDKIIVTQVFTNVENIDSIVRTMYFKKGSYQKSEYKYFYNNKPLIGKPTIYDLLRDNDN